MTDDLVAQQFVRARLDAAPLPGFPGLMPTSLTAAYDHQDAALGLWPDHVAGWKIGRIAPPWSARFGEERLVGPIFCRQPARRDQ